LKESKFQIKTFFLFVFNHLNGTSDDIRCIEADIKVNWLCGHNADAGEWLQIN